MSSGADSTRVSGWCGNRHRPGPAGLRLREASSDMSEDYPDGADRDALRRVAATSADMSRPMETEFFVAVPDREAGKAVAWLASGGAVARRSGLRSRRPSIASTGSTN